MPKAIWLIVGGLISGLVLSQVYFVLGNENQNMAVLEQSAGDDLEQRLLVLEEQLLEQAEQHQRLEGLVDELLEGRWLGEPFDATEESQSDGESESSNDQAVALTPEQRQQQFRERAQQRQLSRSQRRVERLEGAGFPPDQAAWILEREEEIRLQNLDQQWERRRQNYLEDEQNGDPDNALRAELGEADYERYLEAMGRATKVYVSQIVGSSQASIAGFQAGDEIVRYNGERVFDFNDLNRANVKGEMGEPVVIDLIRNGSPIQLTVERGPLGIVGGRRRGRR